MSVQSIRLTTDEIREHLHAYAREVGLDCDESEWSRALTLCGTVRVPSTRLSRAFPFPGGPHLRMRVELSDDCDDSHAVMMSVSTDACRSVWVITALSIAILLSGTVIASLGVIGHLATRLVLTAMLGLVGLGLATLTLSVEHRVRRLEPCLWDRLISGTSNAHLLATLTLAESRSTAIAYRRWLLPMSAVLMVLLMAAPFMPQFEAGGMSSREWTLVIVAVSVIVLLGLLVAGRQFMLSPATDMQFWMIFRHTLWCLSLTGPVWLYWVCTTYTGRIPAGIPFDELPTWKFWSEGQLAWAMGVIVLAGTFVCAMFVYTAIAPQILLEQTRRHVDHLLSVGHARAIREFRSAAMRSRLYVFCGPQIVLQFASWIACAATLILMLRDLCLQPRNRAWEVLCGSTQEWLGFPRSGITHRVTMSQPTGVAALLAMAAVGLVLLPVVATLVSGIYACLSDWRYRRHIQKETDVCTLLGIEAILADARAHASARQVRLCWSQGEGSAHFKWTTGGTCNIIVDPLLLAMARSGNAKPLQFFVSHEAAHIKRSAPSRWRRRLRWLCPSMSCSLRLMLEPGFEDEFACDLEAAQSIGGPRMAVNVLTPYCYVNVARMRSPVLRDAGRQLVELWRDDRFFLTPSVSARIRALEQACAISNGTM